MKKSKKKEKKKKRREREIEIEFLSYFRRNLKLLSYHLCFWCMIHKYSYLCFCPSGNLYARALWKI